MEQPKPVTVKPKLSKDDLLTFVAKFLDNLLEDTVDELHSFEKTHHEVHTFSAIVDDMDDELTREINPKKLKTMLKVLHNVPLVTYNELMFDNKMIPLIQMKVLQQHVYNLCGYHMSHNLIFFVNYLKSQGKTSYLERINSPSSFWKFHHDLTSYLDEVAVVNKCDRSKYPWKPNDTRHGDYERIYDQVFNRHHPLYKSTYADSPFVEVKKATIEMQFGRFITDFDQLMLIQKQVDTFMQHLDNKEIKLFCFQLACTCHWVSLIVAIVKSEIFFYYFDSKNVNCYNMTEEQIFTLIEEQNAQRIKDGKVSWNEFKKNCQRESLKDINILLKLIPDMFMKKNNIYEHIFKTNFKHQYEDYWKPSIVTPLNDMIQRRDTASIHDHLVDYLGDLKTFLHYVYHMTAGHLYLCNDTKEQMLDIYLEIFSQFDRSLGTISRYKKGKELCDLWAEAKKQLGEHFQPKH